MRKRYRKRIVILLVIAFMFPLLTPFTSLFQTVKAAGLNFGNTHITPYKDEKIGSNPLKRYAVGFMSYEIWSNSAGSWTTKAPGATVGPADDLKWDYTFPFTNRIVRDVTVKRFDPNNTDHVRYFDKSRTGDAFENYKLFSSTVTSGPDISSKTGQGSNSIRFTASLTGELTIGKHQNMREEEGTDICPSCAPGVKVYRYYFPILFEFELDGIKTTSFYSTDGQPLKPSETIDMEKGQTYLTTLPTIADYEYEGYKKSTTGSAPTGAIIPGPPPPINNNGSNVFDGTYDHYQIILYYKKKTSDAGTINVRHMVRTTAGGPYLQKNESTISVETLPHNRTISSDSSYGTIKGQNVAYSGYSSTVNSGTTASVSLSAPSQMTAYVSFFYENISAFTGDFDLIPTSIEYGASFTLRPKDFVLNGCAYRGHKWKIERSGTYESSWQTSMTSDTSYSRSSYPWNIGVGSHSVYMKIWTSCGESDWIGSKTLNVSNPTNNDPPQFQVGFVYPHALTTKVTKVVQGTKLHLIYINDPTVPTPTDPDGDDLYFNGFDFLAGSAFIKSIPSKATEYIDGWHNVPMDTLGFHSVCGMMRDQWGATSTACTYIEVIPPNPVPVAGCPATVIENHPVAMSLFTSNQSYSPMGRAIDHTRDEWTNRLASYPNGTLHDISVKVYLDVYDSAGLKSLQPAECTVIVKPDLPPIAKAQVPSVGIRNQTIAINNISTSPDGDAITAAEWKYKYDSNNNGFADEAWINASGTLAKLNFTPTKVGKYLFYLKVTEEYGKSDDTLSDNQATLTLDVLNNAPEVSFSLAGKNPQPDLDPFTTVSATTMMGWPVYVTNEARLVYDKRNLWKPMSGKLVSGEGRNFGPQIASFYDFTQTLSSVTSRSFEVFPLVNNGFGNNRLSPWRSTSAMTSTFSFPLVETNKMGYSNPPERLYNFGYNDWPVFQIRSNKKNIFFMDQKRSIESDGRTRYFPELYAINPSKLKPVEQFVRPMAFYPNYRYENNELPYDFVIGKPQGFSRQFGSNYRYINPDYFSKWELANGRYIYIQRHWYTDSDSGSGYDYLRDIGVYDARTGQLIGSSFDHPIQSTLNAGYNMSHTKGDNIVFVGEESYNSPSEGVYYRKMRWLEMSPNFEIVHQAVWEAPPISVPSVLDYQTRFYFGYATGGLMFDPSGAMYSYQWWEKNGTKYDKYVTKYNPDYSLAWRLPVSAKGPTYKDTWYSNYTFSDTFPGLVYDFASNEVFAKFWSEYTPDGHVIPTPYEEIYVIDAASGGVKQKLSSRDGHDLSMYHYGNKNYPDGPYGSTNYTINWSGPRIAGPNGTMTIDGNRTSFNSSDNYCPQYQWSQGSNPVYNSAGTIVARAGVPCGNGSQLFGEYMMDGVYVSITSPNNGNLERRQLNISVGPPTTTAPVFKSFTSGQFVSDIWLSDAEVRHTFQIEDVDYDNEWLGFSFRLQDPRNRYAWETDGHNIALTKYVNGARTVLASGTYPIQDKTDYAIRLKFAGNKINLWLNNIPILEATDGQFNTGRFGYFSDKSYVTFGAIRHKTVEETVVWSDQYAIWDAGTATAEVQYSGITYTDPENDPLAASYRWTVQHTPRFISNQGLSAKHNQTFSSAQLTFDKVGDYNILLGARDDPNPSYLHPSNVFDSYRKASNEFGRKVTVHRRPIANKSHAIAADGKVLWTDSSRDPDRYLNASTYSTEATGIDYLATKGIIEKRFYYITPSGNLVNAKLVTPSEIGTYEVGMAVKDEYGAWSEYDIDTVTIGTLPPPNTPPVPGFNSSYTNTYMGVPITFNSTAYDVEDGARTNLPHAYYIRKTNEIAETLQSTSRTSWTKTFNSRGSFIVRQVVEDSAGATAQFERQVNIVNRIPNANVTVPASSNQAAPTKMIVLRPTFSWTYNDADADAQTQYHVRIYRYNGTLQADTNARSGSGLNWSPTVDLPEYVNMYVQVRVFDGYDWSDWSGPKYFYIETNRPPIADFDWLPDPIYEGDELRLLNRSSDPDADPLTYTWVVTSPNGTQQTHLTAEPRLPHVLPGQYHVRLTVSDGKANDSHEATITVRPLFIEGEVNHTAQWYAHHVDAGHETEHAPKDFYAGERLLIRAVVALAPVETVTARITAAGRAGSDLSVGEALQPQGGSGQFAGDLYDERWASVTEGLEEGNYAVQFRVEYANGVVKETVVPIRIIGNVYENVGVHRRQ